MRRCYNHSATICSTSSRFDFAARFGGLPILSYRLTCRQAGYSTDGCDHLMCWVNHILMIAYDHLDSSGCYNHGSWLMPIRENTSAKSGDVNTVSSWSYDYIAMSIDRNICAGSSNDGRVMSFLARVFDGPIILGDDPAFVRKGAFVRTCCHCCRAFIALDRSFDLSITDDSGAATEFSIANFSR